MATTLKRQPKQVIADAIRTLQTVRQSPAQRRKATRALRRAQARLTGR